MRRSKAVSAIALFAGAALALSACGGGGGGKAGDSGQQNSNPGEIGGSDQVYKRPKVNDLGSISVVVDENFHNYQNYTGGTNNSSSQYALVQVLPSPFFTDMVDGKLAIKVDGDLMESIKVTSQEPQVIEWKVRKEAVWSDGKPIDCKDFYLKWLAANSKATVAGADGKSAPLFDSTPTGYQDISKVDCSDGGKTITTTFSKKFADYRGLFSTPNNQALLPAHVLEAKTGIADITKVTDANTEDIKKAAEFFTKGWLGFDPAIALAGGPYKIESSDLKDQTVLVRNDKWWGNPGAPAKIVMRSNGDAQSAAQQLQNKEVVAIAPQADGPVAQQLKGESFNVFTAGGQTYEHIDFNLTRPLFKDAEVRRAIMQCIDRQAVVDKQVKDVNQAAKPLGNFMFMPNEDGYTDHYTDLGQGDVAASKKTLEAAGYKQGTDGIYAKGDQRVSFKLGHKVVQRRADTVRIIQDKCRQAGIDIQDDQAADFNDKRLPASEYDAALFAWVGTPIKSSSYENYASKDKGGSSNYNGYANPKLDELYTAANGELDYNKRKQMMNDVDKILHDDLVSLPMFQLSDFAVSNADISPVSYLGVGGGVMWNIHAWQKK